MSSKKDNFTAVRKSNVLDTPTKTAPRKAPVQTASSNCAAETPAPAAPVTTAAPAQPAAPAGPALPAVSDHLLCHMFLYKMNRLMSETLQKF